MDLDGKVAIVTGAAGRLGKAAASALANSGAAVLLADIDAAGASQTAEHLRSEGLRAAHVEVDVSLDDDVRRMISAAVSNFGGLDVLFNNAGLVGLEHEVGLLDLDVELWDRVLAVNLRSVMLGCKHAIPAMRNRGGGSIINTSSDASLSGDIENYAYAAAKGGINVLTRYVAAGYGKDNIRCNAIAPGIHLEQAYLDSLTPERREFYGRLLVSRKVEAPINIGKMGIF